MTGLAAGAGPETLYVFSFNVGDPSINIDAVVESISSHRDILAWAAYTPGVVILKSNKSAYYLGESLRKIVNNVHCFVVEIDARNLSGWLPQAAWNWFDYHRPYDPTPPKPTTLAGLAAAFRSHRFETLPPSNLQNPNPTNKKP